MFAAKHIPYSDTRAFSAIVLDYLHQDAKLQPFYAWHPSAETIKEVIRKKKEQKLDRSALVEVLRAQYAGKEISEKTAANLEALLSENTFTITTAHQPNLFTGPLYFAYKVLHAIRTADVLNEKYHAWHFVPVYYMGSEDADFAELNHTYVDGKKIEWKKEQKGAVGRMLVDDTLLQLISELEGQLSVEPHGREVIALLSNAYTKGRTIQEATFELVNALYGQFGLIVLIPDHPQLKAKMIPVFEQELFGQSSLQVVSETSSRLEAHYSAQAHARAINLFYLKDHIRERIEKTDKGYEVVNTEIVFTPAEMENELKQHPERFSPNVILRGLFQETILPNICFIGGGGELAYWFQLKDLFHQYEVVFPMLILRNSFLVMQLKWQQLAAKLELSVEDLFLSEEELMKKIVLRYSQNPVSLNGNLEMAENLFNQLGSQAGAVDTTLVKHVEAIRTKALRQLQELEKKMFRAEKRKFSEQQGQIRKLKQALFPGNGLQERKENFSVFYAKWGVGFIKELYRLSFSFEQQFTIISETGEA